MIVNTFSNTALCCNYTAQGCIRLSLQLIQMSLTSLHWDLVMVVFRFSSPWNQRDHGVLLLYQAHNNATIDVKCTHMFPSMQQMNYSFFFTRAKVLRNYSQKCDLVVVGYRAQTAVCSVVNLLYQPGKDVHECVLLLCNVQFFFTQTKQIGQ